MSAFGSVMVHVPVELLPPPSPWPKVVPPPLPPLDDCAPLLAPPLEEAFPPELAPLLAPLLEPPGSPKPLVFVPLEHAAATSPNETKARRPARMRGR
jgi:hypothetical protein